jgi:hypothetical protein
MEVNSICKGYRKYNEDMVFVIKDHLFAIIDAATALCEPTHQPSEGVFLNNKIKEYFLDLYKRGKITPKNFIKQMNNLSKKIYKDFIKGNKNIKERYQFPNASMAFCLIDVCDVHVFTIGDCCAFIRRKDNKCKFMSDKSIPLMDKKVVEYYQKLGKYEFSDMYEKLRYNRSLLNKGGRRSTFSLYKKPNIKFKHEVFDIRDLVDLYLCSDGYYDAFEDLKLYESRRHFFSKNVDLQDVYRQIVKESEKEDTLVKYPRLKRIDDISAIRVVF